MDEQQASPSVATGSFGKVDLWLLLFLLALSLGLRCWQFAHTPVTARDSIGYIRIAWRLEREIAAQRSPAHNGDWPRVVRTAVQHPGYPAVLLLVSQPLRSLYPGDLPAAMQASAQFTSMLAAVLLVVPMYLFGRGTFGRWVGCLAVVLYQCLPTSGRLMADGLSEPVFLLWSSTALLFARYGLRGGSPWWFAGVGLFGGLAYLTRPEGAFIVAATGLVLVGCQWLGQRRSWPGLLQSGGLLAWSALSVAGPFVLIVGGLTTKNTAIHVLQSTGPAAAAAPAPTADPVANSPEPAPTDSLPSKPPPAGGAWWDEQDHPPAVGSASLLFLSTLGKSFYYVLWLPALLGVVLERRRLRTEPVLPVLLLIGLTLGYFLYRVPVVMGYLSDRHMVFILYCGIFWAASGIAHLGTGLAALVGRLLAVQRPSRWRSATLWTAGLAIVVCAAALVKTLEPLHTDRLAFRSAGLWLRQNSLPGDPIDDPYCWASYYAGRVFAEGQPNLPQQVPAVTFVVVEQSVNRTPRLHPKMSARQVSEKGKLLEKWPVPRAKEMSQVIVYEVPQ